MLTSWSTHNIPENVSIIVLHHYASNQKLHQDFYAPLRFRSYYSSEYFKHYWKFQHSHKHTLCGNYAKKFTEPYIGYLYAKCVNYCINCNASSSALYPEITWVKIRRKMIEGATNRRTFSGLICDCQVLMKPTNMMWR